MTRGEIKSYCAAKLGINDVTTLAQAETFTIHRWRMLWNNQDWRQARHADSVEVAAGTQEVTLPDEFEFVKACRWAGQNELLPLNDISAFMRDPAGYDQLGLPMAFSQIGKDSTGAARIRLQRAPQQAGTLLVIGKRKCVNLATDDDSPLLPGVDECLCAFVMGDLEQWQRQFTKAREFFTEANALLAKMVEIETAQTSEIRQIIPIEQQLGDGETWLP